MHKESPDLRVIAKWVEQIIFPSRCNVAAKKGLALAPTSATDNLVLPAARGFENKVRSVRNQLAVYAENRAESSFDLGLRVILHLQ